MMQIDEILDDLKARQAALTKITKEISADKTKAAILTSVESLISKIGPLVTETKRLGDLRSKMKTYSANVDTLNSNRKLLINTFNTLKSLCGTVKTDTKDKDFDKISKDAVGYVALNDFEKVWIGRPGWLPGDSAVSMSPRSASWGVEVGARRAVLSQFQTVCAWAPIPTRHSFPAAPYATISVMSCAISPLSKRIMTMASAPRRIASSTGRSMAWVRNLLQHLGILMDLAADDGL
jgi:hypothetical protein